MLPARARAVAVLAMALASSLLLAGVPLHGSHAPGAGSGSVASAESRGDDLEQLRSRREALAGDLDELTAELDGLAVRITDAREARERLTAEVRELEREAARADRALRTRAVATYVTGGPDPVNLLLSADDPGEALARSRVLGGLGSRERRMIERATAARAALGQRQAALDEVLAELEADEDRLAVLQERVSAAFELARAEEHELASRRARQRRVSRGGQRGFYACPLAAPYHFRDTWGAPRSGGRRHKGVDIFAPTAADVYAITDGTILRHSTSRLGGLGLYLAGDDGHQYYYAHLQEILPGYGPGRRVEAGELIARNGSTGNATANAPHVHFEVRPGGGGHVNPYPFAAAACF